MSAIADDKNEVIKVLFTLHDGFDTLDFTGPMETLSHALHDKADKTSKAFEFKTAALNDKAVTSAQGLMVRPNMDFEDAEADLEDFDVLVVTGGNSHAVLDGNLEPLSLVRKFADLQMKDPSKERTLFSVCTGSLFLARAGILQGLAATTHPDHYTRLEMLCQEASVKDTGIRTDVMEERYVVNNARYELGEKPHENPFILPSRPDGRRKSIARKGSDAWKLSKRRESIVKRANLPLGGLRVITSGGITAGIDASLYLVAAVVSVEAAQEVARVMAVNWAKGVTVEGVDV